MCNGDFDVCPTMWHGTMADNLNGLPTRRKRVFGGVQMPCRVPPLADTNICGTVECAKSALAAMEDADWRFPFQVRWRKMIGCRYCFQAYQNNIYMYIYILYQIRL